MKIHLIAVGEKMPAWVQQGFTEYTRRLPTSCSIVLKEVAPGLRGKNADLARAMRDEGERMLAALPNRSHSVALEVSAKPWSTEQLARQLKSWLAQGSDVALLVGGPDGLDARCTERAHQRWSLGPLTLPHPLVRVIVAEQLYRAWTILQGHPYHRA